MIESLIFAEPKRHRERLGLHGSHFISNIISNANVCAKHIKKRGAVELPPAALVFPLHAPSKLINASARIDEFLTSRVKRMALGTDVNVDRFFRRACFKRLAACATHNTFAVFRMYSFFHLIHLSWQSREKSSALVCDPRNKRPYGSPAR